MINFICLVIVFCVAYIFGRFVYIRKEPDLYEAISSLVDLDDGGKRDVFKLFDRCHKLAKKDRPLPPVKKDGKDVCLACGAQIYYHHRFCPYCGNKIDGKEYDWNTCDGVMKGGE